MVESEIPGPAPENEIEFEHPRRHVRIGVHWKKPPTYTYPSNFGYGVNSYQSMIDYLDAKDIGATCSKKDIHLPYSEERCMDQYSAMKPFRHYSNRDIDNYIEKGENIVREIRQNDAIGCGSSLTRTHTNWSMSKKWVQLVKKSHVIDYRKLRDDIKAEKEAEYTPITRTNRRRAFSRQSRSRTPSLTRLGARSQSRSGTPVRTRGGSVVPRRERSDKMVQTYEDVLSTLAHSKLDHEMLMVARRERLNELDSQFEDVISNLASNLSRLNQRAENLEVPATCYDNAMTRQEIMDATEDQIMENKHRRQRELSMLNEGVNELTSGRSKATRQALTKMDYELDDMSDRLSTLSHRQRDERLADLDALTALTQAAAAYAARKKLARTIDSDEIEDADIEYLRKRNAQQKVEKVTVEKPKPKKRYYNMDKFSDVHARVINKASEMTSGSSAARRIQNRARFVNIYSPKPDTGDQELIVKPSRTEINIDNMAKSLAERGKMTRRYAIDEEVDPPVSNINTNATNLYLNREIQRTIAEVPSNSSRVRYATIRARARNTLLGH